jgi:hypothetical protein
MNVETLLECAGGKHMKEFFVGACLLFCESIRTRGNYHEDSDRFREAAFRHGDKLSVCGQGVKYGDYPATTITTGISGMNAILEPAKHI